MISDDGRAATQLEDPAGDPDAAPATRRPIPLPPKSLRPPPRAKVAVPPPSEPRAHRPAPEPRDLGTRRGFLLGLTIPLLGIVVGGGLWWWGTSGRDVSSPPSAGVSVTAHTASEPASEPAAAEPNAAIPAQELLALQVASFRTRQRAEEVLAEAQGKTGLAGLVVPGDVDGTRWYRILLGTFTSPEEAKRAAKPLLDEGMILDVLVRPVPPRWADAIAGEDLP